MINRSVKITYNDYLPFLEEAIEKAMDDHGFQLLEREVNSDGNGRYMYFIAQNVDITKLVKSLVEDRSWDRVWPDPADLEKLRSAIKDSNQEEKTTDNPPQTGKENRENE